METLGLLQTLYSLKFDLIYTFRLLHLRLSLLLLFLLWAFQTQFRVANSDVSQTNRMPGGEP